MSSNDKDEKSPVFPDFLWNPFRDLLCYWTDCMPIPSSPPEERHVGLFEMFFSWIICPVMLVLIYLWAVVSKP